MENEKDKKTVENTNEQPKPTDDVQLEIETVVPSAHQAEIIPGQPESDGAETKETSADEEKPKAPLAEEKDQEPAATTKSETKNEDTETSNENVAETQIAGEDDAADGHESESDKNGDDPDDKRNDIETITPSA